MAQRVAVVTGSNKGIGYAIVKDLCKKFDGIVYLTARNVSLGETAVEALKKEGLNPHFHQLDISDQASVNAFAEYIRNKHKGFDVLVNNAAIAYKNDATESFAEQAEVSININFTCLLNTCKALFPLLRPHARVVNLSSFMGLLQLIPGDKLKAKLGSPNLTEDELCQLMKNFVEAAKSGNNVEEGWGNSSYIVTKVGVAALSMLQQREFDNDPREDIIVNAVNPGHVDTDMSSHRGHLTPDQGAEAPSYLALLPPNVSGPKGKLVWNDKEVVDWHTKKLESW